MSILQKKRGWQAKRRTKVQHNHILQQAASPALKRNLVKFLLIVNSSKHTHTPLKTSFLICTSRLIIKNTAVVQFLYFMFSLFFLNTIFLSTVLIFLFPSQQHFSNIESVPGALWDVEFRSHSFHYLSKCPNTVANDSKPYSHCRTHDRLISLQINLFCLHNTPNPIQNHRRWLIIDTKQK